jgi:hypothetical protein
LKWLEDNFERSPRSARNYMSAAKFVSDRKLELATVAKIAPGLLYRMGHDEFPEDVIQAILQRAETHHLGEEHAEDIRAELAKPVEKKIVSATAAAMGVPDIPELPGSHSDRAQRFRTWAYEGKALLVNKRQGDGALLYQNSHTIHVMTERKIAEIVARARDDFSGLIDSESLNIIVRCINAIDTRADESPALPTAVGLICCADQEK